MFFNADSGLYFTQYRAYNPVFGRWLSRDPIGESSNTLANLYTYVGGDPHVSVDPLGLCTFHVGVSFNGQAGWFNGQAGWGVAFDTSGNIGTYGYGGVATGMGAGATFGVSGQASNADTIIDLNGLFPNQSVSAAAVRSTLFKDVKITES